MGPIAVREHLAPFLPQIGEKSLGEISGNLHGSSLILLISYAYNLMLGSQGIQDITAHAILNSNYMVEKLSKYYKVLYTGSLGRVAHEFIIDIRPFK